MWIDGKIAGTQIGTNKAHRNETGTAYHLVQLVLQRHSCHHQQLCANRDNQTQEDHHTTAKSDMVEKRICVSHVYMNERGAQEGTYNMEVIMKRRAKLQRKMVCKNEDAGKDT